MSRTPNITAPATDIATHIDVRSAHSEQKPPQSVPVSFPSWIPLLQSEQMASNSSGVPSQSSSFPLLHISVAGATDPVHWPQRLPTHADIPGWHSPCSIVVPHGLLSPLVQQSPSSSMLPSQSSSRPLHDSVPGFVPPKHDPHVPIE